MTNARIGGVSGVGFGVRAWLLMLVLAVLSVYV
jgi:hypothetical protein